MSTVAISTDTPTIVCPSWCVVPYAEHVEALPNWEGFVIHWSAETRGVRHSRCAYVDNVPDPEEPPLVFVHAHTSDGISLEEAEALATRILAAVKEARA